MAAGGTGVGIGAVTGGLGRESWATWLRICCISIGETTVVLSIVCRSSKAFKRPCVAVSKGADANSRLVAIIKSSMSW